MSDRIPVNDPGAIWRQQPEEKNAVTLEQIVNRRTGQLYASTRSEILMSIAAALLFVAVMAWRLAPFHGRFEEIGFLAVLAWVAISVYRFRDHIWRRDRSRPDTVAVSGLEYYRKELEWRRDHLRSAWIWHGPLLLAGVLLLAVLLAKPSPVFQPMRNVLPLLILLAVWTAYGLRRRYRQAKELQREIDEIRKP